MGRIISGRFRSKDRAGEVRELIERQINKSDTFISCCNPPVKRVLAETGRSALAEPHEVRQDQGNFLLSVRVGDPADEGLVIVALRGQGALDIQPSEGEWLDGEWVDFDPIALTMAGRKRRNTLVLDFGRRSPESGVVAVNGVHTRT